MGRRYGLAVLGAAALAMVLVGCGGKDDSASGGSASGVSGDGGASGSGGDKSLTLAWVYDIETLDPARAYILPSWKTDKLIFRALLGYEMNSLELTGNAAERWEVSEDGTEYTFYLVPDQKFSDGTPCTAEDFRYAWMRVLDPEMASPGAQFFTDIVGASAYLAGESDDVPGIEVVDDLTLKVTLATPNLAFLSIVAMNFAFPVPQHVVEDPDHDFAKEPIGNGPYKLAEWRPGELIVLDRNEHYDWGEQPTVDEVRFIMGQGAPQIVQRFEAGEVDILQDIPPGEFNRLRSDPTYEDCWVEMSQGAIRYIFMNVEMPPFDDIRVRQAVWHAVDRERLIKLMNGRADLATGVLPPTLPQHNPDLEGPRHDPELSKSLLADAGFPGGFESDFYYYQQELRQKLAEAIQSDLAEVGIRINLIPRERDVFADEAGIADRYPFAMGEWYQDYPDPSNFLEVLLHSKHIRPEASNNYARYSNPAVDALLDEAKGEANPERRTELYRQAEELAMADYPWVPLHHEKAYILHQPHVSNVNLHPVDWIELEIVDVE
jgi:ABC-type transport system substrate-binding protein